MPLIILTGLPCSGKTFRAQQIAADLNALIASDPAAHSKKSVQIVPSQHASAHEPYEPGRPASRESVRDQIYNSTAQEKTARAEEFSAIKRAVSKDKIVIADGLNYIKGYRYQLWCEAKAAATRCCVVHVAAREDECKTWNGERQRAWVRDGGDEPARVVDTQTPATHGTDVLGHLVPESHTAIYGDRRSWSRSSSLDGEHEPQDRGGDEAEAQAPAPSRPKPDDTMTLKSLYITDRQGTERGASPGRNSTRRPPSSTPAPATSLPSACLEPPAPTASPPYSPATLVSLAMRYEPPSPFSRWDTPLFTIPSSDATPPTQAIWAALFPQPATPTSRKALSQIPAQNQNQTQTQPGPHGPPSAVTSTSTSTSTSDPAVKPHAATVLPRATAADALQILESATMDVAKHVLARAREPGGPADGDRDGGNIALAVPTPTAADPDACYETTLYVPAGIALSQPMLQRLRRKYTQIQRGGIAHGQGYVSGRRRVVEDFVDFLDREWNDAE